ncbi:unnamed protein product [Closterium sp. NIES-54]
MSPGQGLHRPVFGLGPLVMHRVFVSGLFGTCLRHLRGQDLASRHSLCLLWFPRGLLWLHILPPSPSRPFDESVPYYTRYPCRGLLVPPPPLFLTPTPPPAPQVQPPPSGPAPSGVSHATPPPPVAPQVSFPSPESSSQSPQQPSTLPPQATADPEGAGVRSADPGGSGAGGARVGAEPESAGSSSLQGAGVSRTVPGGATTGNAMSGGTGAPPTGPGESGTGRVAAGGAGSGGGATGALESGPEVTTAPDTTPLPHPYPTRHQARVRCALAGVGARGERVGAEAAGATAAGGTAGATAAAAAVAGGAAVAGAATAAATAARAAAAAAAGGATVVAAAGATAASTSSSCFWSSGPRSPLSLSSLLLLSSPLTASLSAPVTHYYRRFCPVLSRVLASLVADPRASLPSISALTAAVTEFASTRHLDYATHLVGAPPTSPLAIGGDSALGCDALEDRQFELEFLADEGSPGIEPLAPLHSHSHTWCSRSFIGSSSSTPLYNAHLLPLTIDSLVPFMTSRLSLVVITQSL